MQVSARRASEIRWTRGPRPPPDPDSNGYHRARLIVVWRLILAGLICSSLIWLLPSLSLMRMSKVPQGYSTTNSDDAFLESVAHTATEGVQVSDEDEGTEGATQAPEGVHSTNFHFWLLNNLLRYFINIHLQREYSKTLMWTVSKLCDLCILLCTLQSSRGSVRVEQMPTLGVLAKTSFVF